MVALVTMFFFFCFEADEKSYNFDLFYNNFRVEGMLSWFLISLNLYAFIGLISFVACVEIKNQLIKAIFFSIIWDSIFNILNLIVFGHSYHPALTICRNISTIVALLYAYFVLFNETDEWAKKRK
jgi:hypothetical protein